MTDRVEIKQSRNFSLFVPAAIDEYGFAPEEFRVFSHIVRRAAGEKSKGCFASIPTMSKDLQISEKVVRRSLNVLLGCGAISRTFRPGQTDILDFNNFAQWKPKELLESLREKYTPGKKDTTSSGGKKATTTGSKNDRGVVAKTTDEGIPSKEEPFKENKVSKETCLSNQIQEVFLYWQTALNHPKAVLTTERKRKIAGRLRDYSVEQVKQAIDGCKRSPYHQGENDTGAIYDDIELICRNGVKTEQFIGYLTVKAKENGNGKNGGNNRKLTTQEFIDDTKDFYDNYVS